MRYPCEVLILLLLNRHSGAWHHKELMHICISEFTVTPLHGWWCLWNSSPLGKRAAISTKKPHERSSLLQFTPCCNHLWQRPLIHFQTQSYPASYLSLPPGTHWEGKQPKINVQDSILSLAFPLPPRTLWAILSQWLESRTWCPPYLWISWLL